LEQTDNPFHITEVLGVNEVEDLVSDCCEIEEDKSETTHLNYENDLKMAEESFEENDIESQV
jgi:hypothetical protein